MVSINRVQMGKTAVSTAVRVKGQRSGRLLGSKARWLPRRLPAVGKAAKFDARFRVLHEIFEAQADARPDAVAVVFDREQTTYADLERRANCLARHLRARGVRRGSLVALLLPRSADAYAAMLGVLKVGAAYVPLDPQYPADRVAFILEDCGAKALVTVADLADRHAGFRGAVVRVDADRAAIDTERTARLAPDKVGVGPRDLCYVIYTSGSTGHPKGVMIEHRSACHLVRAEGKIYRVRPEDRVYQGFSLSFDASVEEIWLSFHAGATLVAATPDMAQAGPDLWRMLADMGVTVLSCVPTLLSMFTEDIPTVRLLILGGEACPEQLVPRWARPGRRMLNTYGPTETTVIATYADLVPGKPVTIGRSITGYRVHLLDDQLQPVPQGEAGEICISGVGVARGYVGLPEQTRARFVPDPFGKDGERIYRTGDLGRFDAEGNIEFLGRADSQVKIRGFRVELSEIDSVLMQCDDVRAAACMVHEEAPGVQQLVGYVVPCDGAIDEKILLSHLRDRLPPYMVPAVIETVRDLPRLPSGKLDRKSLPPPHARKSVRLPPTKRPRTNTEREIAEVWEALFHPLPVSVGDDFFLDLGGHSLLAARMVSKLRKNPKFASLSMSDVYNNPTIVSLATVFDTATRRITVPVATSPQSPAPLREKNVGSTKDIQRRHFLAGVLQSVGLYFVFGINALRWVTPYLVYFILRNYEHSVLASIAWAAASTVLVFPVLLVGAVAAKWLLLGRIRPGRHPLWGGYHVRWWFAHALIGALHINHLQGTPLLPVFYRLLGARMGRDVHLDTHDIAAYDLISIGDGTTVDEHASLLGWTVEDGELVVGLVQVGRHCFIGTRSVLREHTVMEDGARLDDLSLLPRDGRIPAGETWTGSPARRAAGPTVLPVPTVRGPFQRAVIFAAYLALGLVFPVLVLSAFVPGVAILIQIDLYAHPFLYLAATPLVGASFVLALTTGTTLLKWLLLGRVRAGTYPLHGWFYMRKWIIDQLLAVSLETAGSLHATLYLAPWYRALGAELGNFVELSTATSMTPDLLAIGNGGTVADEASLGSAHVEGGWVTLKPTRLGQRAFVGNGAVIPQGTAMGDNSLVGVLSIAPSPDKAARAGASWLGSPPISLPRRQPSKEFPVQTTYAPTRNLRLQRGAFEILRVTLPTAGFIIVLTTVLTVTLELWGRVGTGVAFLLMPIVYAASCAALALVVAAAKWAIMGRFQPFEHPQWSWYVWKLEFVNALYEFMLTPILLNALLGTPFLPWYYRLLGARLGRRTYFHTTGLIEFDLVEAGDEAVFNDDSVLQAHLFEDRVLKASWVRIGRRCEVGAGSVVLYDTKMEDGSKLDALSLLMKGETLPAGTAWAGSPARRRKD